MLSKTCIVANTSLASNVVAYLVPLSIREGASCLVITLAAMLLRIELCLKAVLQCVDLICSRSGLLDIATKLCR